MDRSTIEQVVLDQIYLSQISAHPREDDSDFSGYPLNAEPKHASLLFYLVWPFLIVLVWWLVRH